MRVFKALAIFAMALVVSACGQWSPPLPTAPSDVSDGATITGTVVGMTSSAALETSASTGAGGTVTVVGTNITASISGSGKFVLKGLPSGTLQLRFEGQGFDATVTVHDVRIEHIQITVTVTGSQANIETIVRIQPEDVAEVDGVISAISHGDRSMKVNGLEIKVWDAPIYDGSNRIGISQLQVGQRVRVKGTAVHDYIVAIQVSLYGTTTPQPPAPGPQPPPGPTPTPPPGGQTIEGVISSISYGDRSMKVNGIEVKVRDAPIYQGSSRVGITMLQVGQRVRVTGAWEQDYIIATQVNILQ